ncbi:MAG: hypothetical protein KDD37_03960 [Bdellovibrionales bacterium]|nr:hypothetical protein [Bdellovibrionales bacterium]
MKLTVFLLFILVAPMLMASEKEVRAYRDKLEIASTQVTRVANRVDAISKDYQAQADAADGYCIFPKDFFTKKYPETEAKKDLAAMNAQLEGLAELAKRLSPRELETFRDANAKITDQFFKVQVASSKLHQGHLTCKQGHEMKANSGLEEKSNPLVPRMLARDPEAIE